MNDYEKKQQARRERMLARAEKVRAEAAATLEQAHKMSEPFYMGQPILVDHYSGPRMKRLQERIHAKGFKGAELYKQADELEAKAESVGTGGISSDDPEALDKLRVQLRNAEASQELMKKANAIIRKVKDHGKRFEALVELGLKTETAEKILAPGQVGGIGFARFQHTNNNAKIRRLKARIEELEKKQALVLFEREYDWGLYREDPEENRVMFNFGGKPSDEFRELLRSKAFKWSPSRGMWVRQMTGNAVLAGRRLCTIFDNIS